MNKEIRVCINLLFSFVAVCLLYIGTEIGWVQRILNADKTYLVYVITSIFAVCNIAMLFDKLVLVRQLCGVMITLGLIGTALGIFIALENIEPSKFSDINYASEMASYLLSGTGTALSTTIVGAVGFLWVELQRITLGDREI